jgi:hypothetical protein
MPVNCAEILLHLAISWHNSFFLLDSCTLGTGSFPGVKRPGRGDRHSPPFISEVSNGFELYLRLYPVPAYACYVVTFTFPLTGFYWGSYCDQPN